MSSTEGPIRVAATAVSTEEGRAAEPVRDPETGSVHGSDVSFSKEPQTGSNSTGGVFDSPIYINLASKNSSPEEKLAAGYKLVEAQKKDLEKMSNRLLEIQTQLSQKEQSVSQLYDMVEQVSPMLNQLSNWNEKLSSEESQLRAELKAVKRHLGIDGADTDFSDAGSVRATPQEGSCDLDPLLESTSKTGDTQKS